ncbi:MAG: extracellular solute-binding protein [Selenomonadaceae bacterium]|nr:extracellular solute-binding protein [Selenomonadaceae bacterium]
MRLGLFAGSNWNVPQGETYIIIDEVIERFEAEHPNVRVKYVSGIKREDYSEWLAEQFLDDAEPDIFFVPAEDFNMYSSMGALMDLTRFLLLDGTFDPTDYYPAAYRYGLFEDKPYALPRESVLTFMFVNKSLLAREGIAMPSNDWTWTEFLDICRRVTRDTDGDGQLDQFGCYDYSWKQAVISNGLNLFREDGKASYFASARMEETVKFMMELRSIHRNYEVSPKDFDMGRVAFRPFSFAEYRTYKPYPWRIKKYTLFDWDCLKMPAGVSNGNTSTLDTLLVGMSARTNEPELAWSLLKALCYDKTTQEMILRKSQALPTRRDVVLSTEAQEIFQWNSTDNAAMTSTDISAAMDEAVMPPKFKGCADAMLYADSEITKIISGVISFSNALNRLQKEINARLQY